MILVPIIIAAIGLVATLFCRSNIVSHCALFTVVGLAIMVPSHSPPREVLTTAVLGAIAVLVVAAMRSYRSFAAAVPNVWLIAFLIYSSGVMFFETDGSYTWFIFLSCVSYVLISLLLSQQETNGSRVLFIAVPLFVIVQFALATSEEFFDVKALWPLTNGTDFITHRLNTVAPWLAGRAMGSTSHPIPLGILMGLSLVLCMWMAFKKRRRIYWVFVALAATSILFSGTRSAILAALMAAIFWFTSSAGSKRLPFYMLAGSFGLIAILSVDTSSLPELSGFYSSESYTHRANVLEFMPALADRPLAEIFFGSGYSSIASLLQMSIFSGGSGILVFDQEYVRTVTATGLFGFGLLCMAIVEGFRRGNIPSKLVLVFLCIIFASFDALSWNLSMTLFIVAASGPIMQDKPEAVVSTTSKSLQMI